MFSGVHLFGSFLPKSYNSISNVSVYIDLVTIFLCYTSDLVRTVGTGAAKPT